MLRLKLAQEYFKGQRSNINSKLQFSMSLCDQYVISCGHYLTSSIHSLFTSYSKCCCSHFCRNSWGSCWHINILIQNCNFFISLFDQYELRNGSYFVRHQVFMVFLGIIVCKSAAGCISGGTKVGCMLEQEYFEGHTAKKK